MTPTRRSTGKPTAGRAAAVFYFASARLAVVFRFAQTLIGEAASHVPVELRELAPEVAWRQMIGARNRLAHAYLQIDPETVWLMATQSVPLLRTQLQAMLTRLDQTSSRR